MSGRPEGTLIEAWLEARDPERKCRLRERRLPSLLEGLFPSLLEELEVTDAIDPLRRRENRLWL